MVAQIVFIVLFFCQTVTVGMFDIIGLGAPKEAFSASKELLVTPYDKYVQQSAVIEQRLEIFAKPGDDAALVKRIEKVVQRIQQVRQRIKETPVDECQFAQNEIQLLTDTQQELLEIQQSRRALIELLEQTKRAYDEFLKDPEFSNLRVADKSSYEFAEYQGIAVQVISLDEEQDRLREQRRTLEEEIGKINRGLGQIDLDIRSKERNQRELTQDVEGIKDNLDVRQKGRLIDLQKELLAVIKENKELKRMSLQQELEFVEFKLFVTKSKIQTLQENATIIERSLYVNEVDVFNLENAIAQRKSELQAEQIQKAQSIAQFSEQRERVKRDFEQLNASLNNPIRDKRLLSEWAIESSLLISDPDIIRLGNVNDAILRLEREITLLNARQDLVKLKMQADDLSLKILRSWYRITQRKFKDDAHRQEEIAMYQSREADLRRELATVENQENSVKSYMSSETRALSNVKRRIEDIQAQAAALTERFGQAGYRERLDRLRNSEVSINRQLDLNGQILKTYSNIKSTIKDLLKDIDLVVSKLQRIGGVWQRSPDAIDIASLKTITQEARIFVNDLAGQLQALRFKHVMPHLIALAQKPRIAVGAIYLLLVALVMFAATRLRRFVLRHKTIAAPDAFLSALVIALLVFFLSYIRPLLVGLTLYLIGFTHAFADSTYFGRSVICLLLMILALFLAHRLVTFLDEFNARHGYLLCEQVHARRMVVIGSVFAYTLITLFFLKHAYIELTYGKSLLPAFVQSLITVLLKSLLVLIVSKKFIMSLLPTTHPFSYWVRDLVDRYYWVAITVIMPVIIISDPYIGGYGKLVSFVALRSLLSAASVLALIGIHSIIKTYSADIFFILEEDTAKERFEYAKTTYGLFIVFCFVFLLAVGVFIGAYIWQHRIPLDRFAGLINFELFAIHGTGAGGTTQVIPFTVKSLVILGSFIAGGLVLAWFFEHFVLDKIFNLFMVDAGIQNTASRISHYLIVVIVFFIALQRVNLAALIPYGFTALAVAIAWALKGPANDIASYFTILIERSIKIGDYVSLQGDHEEVFGVVRKITPRTTVLRKKNSTTIIVPNSLMTGASVVNWNYTRGFFAFDDMYITVPFGSNVERVRAILMAVLDNDRHVLKNPAPIVRLEEFGEYGYEFLVRGFLSSSNVLNQWDITSDIRFEIVRKLSQEGIEIACPVRVVQVKDGKNGVRAVQDMMEHK